MVPALKVVWLKVYPYISMSGPYYSSTLSIRWAGRDLYIGTSVSSLADLFTLDLFLASCQDKKDARYSLLALSLLNRESTGSASSPIVSMRITWL